MRVAVLGAGVIGVTTAWYLTRAGHTVTLIDRESKPAYATSRANGSQLCYSFTDAMASPSFVLKIPGLLAGMDPAIRIRPQLDRSFLRWSSAFLGECTTKKANLNTSYLLQAALRSAELLESLRQSVPLDFAYRPAGKLVLLRSAGEKADAVRASSLKSELGCEISVIGLDDAIDIEPAVAHMNGNYVGAIYSPTDAVGDARAFTNSLADRLRLSGQCTFELCTSITRIVTERQRVHSIETDQGVFDADAVVVCLGPWSSSLLKPLGIDPGIYPARGYSVTLPQAGQSPSVSVTDLGKRFVISRTGDRMRIAGFADFVGYDTKRDPQRIHELMSVARRNAPGAAQYDANEINSWGGFRPMTVSGRPLVGDTAIEGLYLNTGHGSLGWTLACVSGHDIAAKLSYPDISNKSLAA